VKLKETVVKDGRYWRVVVNTEMSELEIVMLN
jgi:hypothetical protein